MLRLKTRIARRIIGTHAHGRTRLRARPIHKEAPMHVIPWHRFVAVCVLLAGAASQGAYAQTFDLLSSTAKASAGWQGAQEFSGAGGWDLSSSASCGWEPGSADASSEGSSTKMEITAATYLSFPWAGCDYPAAASIHSQFMVTSDAIVTVEWYADFGCPAAFSLSLADLTHSVELVSVSGGSAGSECAQLSAGTLYEFGVDADLPVASFCVGGETWARLVLTPIDPAFTDLGSGLAGVSGVPDLSGNGTLAAGSAGSLSLTLGAPSSPALLFVAPASAPVPFKGGVLIANPFTLEVALATDGSGALLLAFVWPSGVPAATSLYFQYAIQDAAGPQGASLSNALKGVTP